MKVRTKFKINNSFIASMKIMADKDDDKKYWNNSINFVEQVKEQDCSQLSKNQLNWLVKISLELKKEGLR